MQATFRHYRYDQATGQLRRIYRDKNLRGNWEPHPRGGMTVCTLRDCAGQIVAHGLADCSKRDAFSYAKGRFLSHQRALEIVASISHDKPNGWRYVIGALKTMLPNFQKRHGFKLALVVMGLRP